MKIVVGNCLNNLEVAKLTDRDEVIKILKDCDIYCWAGDLDQSDLNLFNDYKSISDEDWERILNNFCDDGVFEIKKI